MVTNSLKINPDHSIELWKGLSLIEIGVMFSFPNVDILTYGIAILLENLAPEKRG